MVHFKIAGLTDFELELEENAAVRDVKKIAAEHCDVEPEYMRLIYKDRELRDADIFEYDGKAAVQVMFTAGHQSLLGGSQPPSKQGRDPFTTPVRGYPGSKGERISRMSGRRGGMGLIRKYGILMKRQEFREKATEIGFVKYR